MTLKIEGLVLRSVKYGESDKLITILTEEGKMFGGYVKMDMSGG